MTALKNVAALMEHPFTQAIFKRSRRRAGRGQMANVKSNLRSSAHLLLKCIRNILNVPWYPCESPFNQRHAPAAVVQQGAVFKHC